MKNENTKNIINMKIAALAILVAIGFNACTSESGNQKAGATAPQQQPAIPVKVFTIEDKEAVTSKEYPTIIKAFEEVAVQARVQGILEDKFFKEGDFVKKGKQLYSIEDDTYLANLNQAKANFNKADKDYKRAVALLKSKSISNQSYDEYKFAFEDAKAKLEQSQIEFDYTKVLAPIDGIIGIKQHDIGNLVVPNGANSTLVTITQTNPVHAEFQLAQEDVSAYMNQIKEGTIDIDLISKGDTFKGQLDYISPKIDSNTDTLLVRAKFDNPDNKIIVGEFTKLKLDNLDLGEVFVIPEIAILKTNNGTFVYVVDENSTVQLRPVEVGILVKDGIVIKKGLNVGDRVVLSNIAKLRPNSKVMILNKEK